MKQPALHLNELTLSQWIAWQNKYGQALDERIKVVTVGGDPDEIRRYNIDFFTQFYSFYTDIPLKDLAKLDEYGIIEVIKIASDAHIQRTKEAIKLDFNKTFRWNGQKWKIQPIFEKSGPKLTYAQYELQTDIDLIWSDLQDGKHEALYEMCAAYLRHPGEKYTTELMYERKGIMPDLPYDIALCVVKYNRYFAELAIKMIKPND